LLSHLVYSVENTCSACDPSKASLIGDTVCNQDGSLTATCSEGPIRTTVEGKLFDFDRVTCLNGTWFGTSCDGIAVHLAKDLPLSKCPQVEFPEEPIEGSLCTIRAIGVASIYEEYFTAFPKLGASGFVCEEKESWTSVSHSEISVEGSIHLYSSSTTDPKGYKKLTSPTLTCALNAATSKHEFAYSGTTTFVGTNQIECLYKKCPPFHTYNKTKGVCEPETANGCGYALVIDSATDEIRNSYLLAESGNTPIPTNCTHVVVFPGCKVNVFGSKDYEGTTVKIPLVFEQTFGLWAIFSAVETDLTFPGFNAPSSVFCVKEAVVMTTPVLTGGSSATFEVSEESRYASVSITADATFTFTKLEEGQSFSLEGTGSGGLKCNFIDAASTFGLNFEFNIQTKKFIYKILGATPDEGERDLIIESGSFHIRFVYVRINTLAIYLNGRFFYQIEDKALKFTSCNIKQENVVVEKCKFFVPKKCGKYH
ncbi:hypothetical protein PMAYCL1PPCAC_08240, partial [Pristionchus mayeri]